LPANGLQNAESLILALGAGLVLLLLTAFSRRPIGGLSFFIAIATGVISLFFCWSGWLTASPVASRMLLFDRPSFALDLVIWVSTILTLLFSRDYLRERGLERGEYYPLLLFSVAGLLLVVHGEDLIVIFLGIEIAALATYILTGLRRGVIKCYEASLKYFVLGSFASAFLLYGIALVYGAVGSTSLKALSVWSSGDPLLLSIGLAFLLIGVGFKIAAVPFHFWSPDVYEGAPTPITGFMASAVKVGGFAVLIRVALSVIHLVEVPWVPLLWLLSVLTMTVGNLAALRQANLKRLLAYSSIAHAGYALIGVTAAMKEPTLQGSAFGAVLFYLFAYSVMTLGAFAVVIAVSRKGGATEIEDLSDYAGLGERHKGLAAVMTLFLLSLLGMPPTIGFVGKFYLFSGAIEAGLPGLVVIGVLNSLVSVYYYLAPVMKIYFSRSSRAFEQAPLSPAFLIGLVICVFGVIYLGLFPSDLFLIARESMRGLEF